MQNFILRLFLHKLHWNQSFAFTGSLFFLHHIKTEFVFQLSDYYREMTKLNKMNVVRSPLIKFVTLEEQIQVTFISFIVYF